MKPLSSIFFTLISVSLGLLFTSALSFNTFQFGGVSILFFVTLYIFILQWIIFIPAYVKQTEHYFDLTGSMTYITSILLVTFFSQNIDQIRKFFKKHKKVIVKPINSYSGNNIHLFTKFNLKFFQKFIKKHDHIMCQKYLSKIKEGDKRVFLINGKVCGAISRIPKKGSFLSNLSKGAKPINIKLTNKEMKISKLIGKDLKKDKIFFAGIDFIDEQLNGDINVTSPTGLKTFYDLSKINLASTFWKELKA